MMKDAAVLGSKERSNTSGSETRAGSAGRERGRRRVLGLRGPSGRGRALRRGRLSEARRLQPLLLLLLSRDNLLPVLRPRVGLRRWIAHHVLLSLLKKEKIHLRIVARHPEQSRLTKR